MIAKNAMVLLFFFCLQVAHLGSQIAPSTPKLELHMPIWCHCLGPQVPWVGQYTSLGLNSHIMSHPFSPCPHRVPVTIFPSLRSSLDANCKASPSRHTAEATKTQSFFNSLEAWRNAKPSCGEWDSRSPWSPSFICLYFREAFGLPVYPKSSTDS